MTRAQAIGRLIRLIVACAGGVAVGFLLPLPLFWKAMGGWAVAVLFSE